jgi:hypothetical protein
MARVSVAIRSRDIVGNDLQIELYCVFFGSDMNAPDATLVKVTASASDTPASWRQKRNAAIQTEADRLGISWNGRIISDADLLRDA